MDHSSLILGELREFKRATLERLDVLEKKSDTFQAFRFKLVGVAAFASFLATAIVELFRSK